MSPSKIGCLDIVHGDICPWNLLIDADSDRIQLFDFNCGAKLGWEGDRAHNREFKYDEDRNDVKFVVFTLYEVVTREYSFRGEFYPHELNMSTVLRKSKWKQHPDVQLDSPLPEYRRVLAAWVKERAKIDKQINHFSKTPELLDWPPLPEFSSETRVGEPGVCTSADFRCILIQYNKDFLKWQRPPTRHLSLPNGRRLLSTGEAVLDTESSGTAKQDK